MNLLPAWLMDRMIDRSRVVVDLAVAYQQFSSVVKAHHVSLMLLMSCTSPQQAGLEAGQVMTTFKACSNNTMLNCFNHWQNATDTHESGTQIFHIWLAMQF